MPTRTRRGKGFFGDLVKKGSHGLLDFGLGKLGLGLSGGGLAKGSIEAKARMAYVRSFRKKKGGSFRMN